MDWRHVAEITTAATGIYSELKNICVWKKNAPGMGSLYRSQHELIFVFKHGRQPHKNNILLGKFGRNRSNVWEYPNAATFSRTGDEGNLMALHPTVKPVALVADAILDASSRGDIVLDPFLGSGTTIMAAERTGRRCFGLELEPRYVDTIIRRWQTYTGEQAVHTRLEKSFDELSHRRRPRHADSSDKVGYRRPPEKTRFVKGRSGNPRGRRRGAKNFKAMLRKLLDETVVLEIDGKRQRMSLSDAIAIRLVRGAASGNLRNIDLLLMGDRLSAERPHIIVFPDSFKDL